MNMLGFNFVEKIPPELAQEWNIARRSRLVPFLRIALIFGVVFYPLWLYWDYFVAPEVVSFSFFVRLSCIIFWVILFLGLLNQKIAYYSEEITIIAVSSSAFGLATILVYVDQGYVVGLAGCLLPFMWTAILPSLRSVLITIALMAGAYEISMFVSNTPLDVMINANFFMFTVAFVSGSVSVALINGHKKSFLLETSLLEAKRAAERADRAKSSFLATMSHEVRTPLNGVLGIVNLMQDTPLNPMQRGYLETIKYSSEALLVILNDVLDFSKLEAGKLSVEHVDFDLIRVVRSVIDLMQSRASENGVVIQSNIDADVPEFVNSDPTRLRQVLINLISNAIKFTKNGDVTLHITTMQKTEDRAVLRIQVEDEGIGISEEAQKELFQAFTQADSSISRKYGGTGLGLSICQKILEILGSEIKVTSEVGKGSTFWFDLPVDVVDRASIEHEDEKQDDDYPETKPMDILLAEDNKINQQVIVGLLHKFAHNVTVVSNGQEAVDMLRQRTFDLILMDMQMPVMDGLQATREIKAMGGAGARIPIIAITANALKGDNERCFAAGMVDHVSKPINPAGLFRVIARHAPEHAVLEDTAEQDTSHAKQAIAPVEETAAIDLACLGELEKVMGEQYVRGFINDSMPGLVLYVNQLLKAQGNIQSMLHPAHEVKNLAAMFGLNGVAILTEGIERCCLEGRAQEADELLDRVPPSFNAGIEALRKVYPMERVSL